jgi:hypothetical protein
LQRRRQPDFSSAIKQKLSRQQAQQQMQDPVLQMQMQELQIKMKKMELEEKKLATDTLLLRPTNFIIEKATLSQYTGAYCCDADWG